MRFLKSPSFLFTIELLLYCISAILIIYSFIIYEEHRIVAWFVFCFACLIFAWTRGIHKHHRRLKIHLKTNFISLDHGNYVLYLRSFKIDYRLSNVKTFENTTEEEQLVKTLSKIGPVITVGKPDENLPQLGAKRYYIENSNWKQKLGQYINKAKLVVIVVAFSEGLWWEILYTFTKLSPEKIILLLPLSKYACEQFGMRIYEETGIILPEINHPSSIPDKNSLSPIKNSDTKLKKKSGWVSNAFDKFKNLMDTEGEGYQAKLMEQGKIYESPEKMTLWGYVYFDKRRQSYFVPISSKRIPFMRRPIRNLPSAAYQMAFRTVFSKLNCIWEPPKVSIFKISLLLLIFGAVYFIFIRPFVR